MFTQAQPEPFYKEKIGKNFHLLIKAVETNSCSYICNLFLSLRTMQGLDVLCYFKSK